MNGNIYSKLDQYYLVFTTKDMVKNWNATDLEDNSSSVNVNSNEITISTKTGKENPNTGTFIAIGSLSLLICGSVAILKANKKKKFN